VAQGSLGTSSNITPVIDITSARAGITLASDPNNRATIKLRDNPPGGGDGTELHTPLIQLSSTTNVTIRDIIIDGSRTAYWDLDSGETGFSSAENGAMHCIRVVGGSGHRILGKVNIKNAHADGIYVRNGGSITVDGETSNGVVIEWSRRNGCSPVNCSALTMRNFKFENSGKTIGTNEGQAPQANIDIEPNNNNVPQNILLEDFESNNAAGRGLMIDVRTGGRGIKNATFRRGKLSGNGTEAVRMRTTADDATMIDNITFEDLDCVDSDGNISIGGGSSSAIGHANNVRVTGCALAANRQITLAHQDGNGWNITGNTRAGASTVVVSENNVSFTNSTVQS
jgi:hypothetical protein